MFPTNYPVVAMLIFLAIVIPIGISQNIDTQNKSEIFEESSEISWAKLSEGWTEIEITSSIEKSIPVEFEEALTEAVFTMAKAPLYTDETYSDLTSSEKLDIVLGIMEGLRVTELDQLQTECSKNWGIRLLVADLCENFLDNYTGDESLEETCSWEFMKPTRYYKQFCTHFEVSVMEK